MEKLKVYDGSQFVAGMRRNQEKKQEYRAAIYQVIDELEAIEKQLRICSTFAIMTQERRGRLGAFADIAAAMKDSLKREII